VQNTGPGCKPELGKTLSTAIHPSCVCASAGLIFLRRLSRPFLRAAQNTGDMDDVVGMDINHKVRQRRKHQLARAVHSSRAAYAGKLPQLCRGIVDKGTPHETEIYVRLQRVDVMFSIVYPDSDNELCPVQQRRILY
jgi:hypothetical protein